MAIERVNDVVRYLDELGEKRGTPLVVVTLPLSLLTDTDDGHPRIRVDSAQTGFWAGREFRTFYEYSVPTGQSLYVRATVGVNIVLFSTTLSLDMGNLRFSLYAGGTEGGVWTPAPVLPKNGMTDTPAHASQVQIDTGGTHSGGTLIDVARLASETAGNRASTIGGQAFSERGVPPGVYYYRLENIDGATATGVLSAHWEERP